VELSSEFLAENSTMKMEKAGMEFFLFLCYNISKVPFALRTGKNKEVFESL